MKPIVSDFMGEAVVGIIPARMGSTRFPGKVLADKTGHPLIQHVYEAARRATILSRVVVATDDERVATAVAAFGGEAVMTGDHPNGTSRLAEAAQKLGLPPDAIVVNVQGDEPEMDPRLVGAAVSALRRTGAPSATVCVPFGAGEDPADSNIVKAVLREDGTALCFSRAPVPFVRDRGAARPAGPPYPLRHIGLYAYRRAFLDVYVALPVTAIERIEQLEQLRILAHGHAMGIAVVEGVATHPGIDTPEQYEEFVRRWRALA